LEAEDTHWDRKACIKAKQVAAAGIRPMKKSEDFQIHP
jgi:hypothetical protein